LTKWLEKSQQKQQEKMTLAILQLINMPVTLSLMGKVLIQTYQNRIDMKNKWFGDFAVTNRKYLTFAQIGFICPIFIFEIY
jgi:hypothetical protein